MMCISFISAADIHVIVTDHCWYQQCRQRHYLRLAMSTSHRHHVSCLQAQENRQSQEPRERVHFLLSVMKKCYCTGLDPIKFLIWASCLILSCHLHHMSVTLRLFVTVRFGSYACCAGLFHLKQLMHSCVHSFTPVLDYCNAVLANDPQMLVALLPSVLRSAARVVLRCPHRAYPWAFTLAVTAWENRV